MEILNLVNDLKVYGAILKDDAEHIYSKEVLENMQTARLIRCMSTPMGDILYLSLRGRIMAGFAGAYNPTAQALMNAVFMRKVEELVIRDYGVSIGRDRKHALCYDHDGKRVLALARQNGYTYITVRRLYHENINTNRFNELHLFYYDLDFSRIKHLQKIFFAPYENKTVLDCNLLKIHSVDPHNYTLKTFGEQSYVLPTD